MRRSCLESIVLAFCFNSASHTQEGGGGGVDRYVLPDRVWFLRVSIGYHFCPGWHCVRGMILRNGTSNQMLSAKIKVRQCPATRETIICYKIILTCLLQLNPPPPPPPGSHMKLYFSWPVAKEAIRKLSKSCHKSIKNVCTV